MDNHSWSIAPARHDHWQSAVVTSRRHVYAPGKLAWAMGLQIGDVVCDCKYQHQRITNIYKRYIPNVPRWLRATYWWLPARPSLWVEVRVGRYMTWMGRVEAVDADVELEDGSMCSAMHCCDDVSIHAESDHPQDSAQ